MKKKVIGLIIVILTIGGIAPGIKASADVINNTSNVQGRQIIAQDGWTSISGKWYFYRDNTLVKGWLKDNGSWYYLDSTYGYMRNGWLNDNGKWYYLDPTYGYMRTKWQQIDNKWYYFDSINGYMKTGWQQIDSKWYYFWTSEGSMASDTFVDGYYLSQDGSWISTEQSLVEYGKKFLGTPYIYGGTTPNGFDCSGFTQYVYKQVRGIDISRTTYTQRNMGISVEYSNLRVGDLVFTNNYEHVGIYIGDGKMIHSPQPGDVLKISNIYNFVEGRRI